jgi:hypothetical protein
MSDEADRHAAGAALHGLLVPAAEALRALGGEPAMVASAPNKFNDAGHDDYWCAAQVGGSWWEQSQFFRGDGLRDFARETSNVEPDPADEGEGFGTSLLKSDGIARARLILDGLEKSGWRDLAARAFYADVILALLVQFDQAWLWIGNPQDDGTILAIHSGGIARFAHEEGRLDEAVGDPDLLLPWRVIPESFACLSERALRQFHPSIVDRQAGREVCEVALAAAASARSIAREPVVLITGSTDFRKRRYPYKQSESYGSDHPGAMARGVLYKEHVVRTILQNGNAEVRVKALQRFSFVDFPKLLEVAATLEKRDFRALFETATGVDTFDVQPLCLLVADGGPYLIHHTTLLRVGDRGLTHIGYLHGPLHLNGREEDAFAGIAALAPSFVDLL